jgi:hypothetical protein
VPAVKETEMDAYRKPAVAAGVLFIVATVADVISRVAFLTPVLSSADPLATVSANGTRVVVGALLLVVGAVAASGIAVAMYPVLRRHGEAMALGSVGFRLVEGTFYLGIVVCLLVLVALGQMAASGSDPVLLAVPATLVLAAKEALGQVGVLAFCVGASLYYVAFYRSRLIPRWLSVWGIAAIASLVASVVLVIVGVVEPLSQAQIVLALPIGAQEMVLAGWLIARGFRPPCEASTEAAVAPTLASGVPATAR